MKRLGLLSCTSLLGVSVFVLNACSNEDGRPGSLVSAGGQSSRGGGSARGGGGSSADAGQATDGGSAGEGQAEGGEAGALEMGTPATPFAVFQSVLQVDSTCDTDQPSTSFVIQNGGAMPLVISTARADAGYVITGKLPLTIPPGGSSTLFVTPPAPKAGADIGVATMAALTFTTNEPGSPTQHVALSTTLFGAKLAFADNNGEPLTSALVLTYLGNGLCPDTVKYRVLNTGNLAINLFGPTFPDHFGGTTAGQSGMSVAPGGFVELKVGGVSAPGEVCSGDGTLSFSAPSGACGALPTLTVSWPANAEVSCACTAATE